MHRTNILRRVVVAGTIAGVMAAGTLPVHAVNIPEGGAITPGSSFLFHLRVTSTCEGLPMDTLEVTIPVGVTNPIPEAVPGWDVDVEAPEPADEDEAADEEAAPDEDEETALTHIRWSGGSLADGTLLDFGIRAGFPDEEGEVLEFPVIQRCGLEELESDPTVTLVKRYGQADIAQLNESVDVLAADNEQLRADLDRLQEQVGNVNVVNLRSRVSATEAAIEELDERVTALDEAPTPEPAEPTSEPAE